MALADAANKWIKIRKLVDVLSAYRQGIASLTISSRR